VSVDVPDGGTARLIPAGGGSGTSSLTISGVGTYVVDPVAETITFTPVLGYAGTPAGVSYEVEDAYAQTGRSTYTPTMTPPAGPTSTDKATTGVGTTTQSWSLAVPTGGSATLPDAGGQPVDSVVVERRSRARLGGRVRQVTVDLKGRVRETVRVQVTARTTGKVLSTSRTYHPCRAQIDGPGARDDQARLTAALAAASQSIVSRRPPLSRPAGSTAPASTSARA
jgi:CshA-type fibril repeat protein